MVNRYAVYELGVTAGSNNIHYPREDLDDNPVKSGWLTPDDGEIKVKFDDDGSWFTVKQGEAIDLTGSEIFKIEIEAPSGTVNYRCVCSIFDIN